MSASTQPPSSPLPRPAADEDAVAAAATLVATLADDREALARLPEALRVDLLRACGRLARPDRRERARFNKARRAVRRDQRRCADEKLLERTGIRRQRAALIFPTPAPERMGEDIAPAPRLGDARNCYICKVDYRDVHPFYDALCPECAAFNWRKRQQTADMTGRVALLTGGRVKIGYQTGVKLLRAGSRLIVTTRFPRDAAARYAAEPDFEQWCGRLEIFGLDLRHTPSVEGLARHLAGHYRRLDLIVNNACQTVRRPPGFYAHLMQGEQRPLSELPAAARAMLAAHEQLRGEGVLARVGPGGGQHGAAPGDGDEHAPARQHPGDDDEHAQSGREPGGDGIVGLLGVALSAAMSQLALVDGDDERGERLFPGGRLDADLQQVDLRKVNSWRLPLADVPTVELLEVHLVNAVAPFVLNARLKPLLVAAPGADQHVVNVSAMEGQFYRSFKTDKHPHTNMAKAALNMLTRTSAADYQRDGIHMNSVDTGWITDEDPAHITVRKQQEHGFHPPLDHVDAAARILDPVFDGLNTGRHVWGQFLKDYRPTRW